MSPGRREAHPLQDVTAPQMWVGPRPVSLMQMKDTAVLDGTHGRVHEERAPKHVRSWNQYLAEGSTAVPSAPDLHSLKKHIPKLEVFSGPPECVSAWIY